MRSIAKLACKILSDSTRDSRTSCCHTSAQLSFSPRLPSSSAPGVASQCCSELNQWYRRHRTNAYKTSQSISDHLRPIQYHECTMSCQIIPDSLRLSILVGSEAGCIRFGKRLIFRFLLDSWVDSTWPNHAQLLALARTCSYFGTLIWPKRYPAAGSNTFSGCCFCWFRGLSAIHRSASLTYVELALK